MDRVPWSEKRSDVGHPDLWYLRLIYMIYSRGSGIRLSQKGTLYTWFWFSRRQFFWTLKIWYDCPYYVPFRKWDICEILSRNTTKSWSLGHGTGDQNSTSAKPKQKYPSDLTRGLPIMRLTMESRVGDRRDVLREDLTGKTCLTCTLLAILSWGASISALNH
jgi:hypothetical protein